MADTLSSEQRRRCMSAVRAKDTKPELVVRRLAHGLGLRFRLHAAELPGVPDLVFRSRRSVVFVHGCYWHMHTCKKGRSTPVTNATFWQTKRAATKKRDARQRRQLARLGWSVLVVWECQTLPARRMALADRLRTFLGTKQERRRRCSGPRQRQR